jgi:hypothetical protein
MVEVAAFLLVARSAAWIEIARAGKGVDERLLRGVTSLGLEVVPV